MYVYVFVYFIGIESLTDTVDKENIHANFENRGKICHYVFSNDAYNTRNKHVVMQFFF